VVQQVQQQIVDTIRKLEEAGEISTRVQQEEERYLV
jgi:flagellar motor switch protein FliG